MPNCKTDQIINPASGRCVSKTGKIGKQLLKGNIPKTVPKISPKTVPKTVPKKVLDHPDKDVLRLEICGKDMIRNPNTGRCVKISGPIAKKLMSVPYVIVNPEKPVGPVKPIKYVVPFKPDSKKGYDATGLDQNEDGFVSINEYMDATKSLGPLEKSESGFFGYQQADLGIRFILSLIRNQKGPIHHIGCIPLYALCVYKDSAGKYHTEKSVIMKSIDNKSYLNCDKKIPGYTFGSYISSYSSILIMYAPTNNKLISPIEKPVILIAPNLEESLSKCKNNGKTMAVCELSLITSDDPYGQNSHGHANVIVFDILRKTIERFDPHGGNEYQLASLKYDDGKGKGKITGKKDFKFGNQYNKFGNQLKLKSSAFYDQDAIDKLLSAQFKKVLPDYTYYGTNETTPYLGPQIKADDFSGLCVTWSCMYMVLRLLNPNLSSVEVTRRMIDGKPQQLLDRVLRFQKYIIRTLKKESIMDKGVVPSAYL